MKVLIQRCSSASVEVEGEIVGQIAKGLLAFVCMERGDDIANVEKAVDKLLKVRVFSDEAGKMNLNCSQIEGQILAISQFTLSWNGKGGHRPSFENSMPPQNAKLLFELFCRKLSENIPVEKGVFGADMNVALVNDGPVTFFIEF